VAGCVGQKGWLRREVGNGAAEIESQSVEKLRIPILRLRTIPFSRLLKRGPLWMPRLRPRRRATIFTQAIGDSRNRRESANTSKAPQAATERTETTRKVSQPSAGGPDTPGSPNAAKPNSLSESAKR